MKKQRPPIESDAPKGRGAFVAVAAGLMLLAWVAFAPGLHNEFVNLDDNLNFHENYEYRGLGWSQVVTAFTTPRLGVYQPLGSLLLSAEYLATGMDPYGYHVASLWLHAANAAVLFALTVAFVRRARPDLARDYPGRVALACGLVVALFVAHPLRAEPVVFATTQLYPLSALFYMLSVLAYLHANPADRPSRSGWLWGSYGLALLALLSMPGAVSLPFVFLILDASLLRRIGPGCWFGAGSRRAYLEKVPLLLMSLAFMGIAFWAKNHDYMLVAIERDGPWPRVAQAGFGVWFYLAKTLAPTGITGFYPRPEFGRFDSPLYPALLAMCLVATAGAFLWRRCRPWLPAAWAAYVVMVGPHLGLLRVGNTIAADRYCYVATMAWVLLGALGLCRLATRPRPPRRLLAVVTVGGVLATCGLVALAREQSRTWHDSISLWTQALKSAPGSSECHYGLASALNERGRFDEAIAEYREALRCRPGFPNALNSLGAALAAQGKLDEAVSYYAETLKHHPDHLTAHLNMGIALARQGKLDEAIAHYNEGLRQQPLHAEMHANLGTALLQQGKLDEAIEHYREAVRLKPHYADAHASLGAALAYRQRTDEAIVEYREALRLNPDLAGARVNLGIALAQRGEWGDAVAQLQDALGIEPGNPEAHHALGAILAQRGRFAEAAAEFAEALRLNPDHPQAGALLAEIQRRQGMVRR